MDGQWDIVISSLQDIFNSNEELNFDEIKHLNKAKIEELSDIQLTEALDELKGHQENIEKSRRVLDETLSNLSNVINTETKRKTAEMKPKVGRSYWTSAFNNSDSILMNSEVAFRLRQKGGDAEWIQCQVTKISADGTKFEVRDPEPDENGNPGKTYKATWKDIIAIATPEDAQEYLSYPVGSRVLARYPETTTFYPAEVIGTKRDGRCRLKFEGEEEEGKETEVQRRLVIPYPSK